jgi:hypothetical protein
MAYFADQRNQSQSGRIYQQIKGKYQHENLSEKHV